MNSQNELIDLRHDQYLKFLYQAENSGVSWIFYFKDKKESKTVLLGDARNSDQSLIKEIHQANTIQKLFPELGPFFVFNSLLYKPEVQLPSIRALLKSSAYLFYPNDLVSYEISNNQKIILAGEGVLKNIIFNDQELSELSQFDHIQISLTLLAYGIDRTDHEIYSSIMESQKYLKIISSSSVLRIALRNIKDHELLQKRLEIWKAKDINEVNGQIEFKKINSYERFLEFLALSKYSNKELLNLDQFLFDEEEAKKLEQRLHI